MTCYIKDSFNGTSIRFSIFDKMGSLKYNVILQHLPFIMNIDIYDLLGKKVAKIRQKNMLVLCSYNIHTKNKSFKINISLEHPDTDFKIKGLRWKFKGSVAQKAFSIVDLEDKVIMTQRADFFERGKSYKLDIIDEYNCIPCLCIALCIDTILINDLKDALFFSENKAIKKKSCASNCSLEKN